MDTLRDRLAELADDAPTGGAPAAELWARGKRAGRLRAAALATAVLVVVAVGARMGVGVFDGFGKPDVLLAPGTAVIALPIEYPVGQELPDLGDAPGPLAAIWLAPSAGGAFEVVGLVAETGMFGTLPIEVSRKFYEPHDAYFALSPDGRRIAYHTPAEELVVRDLVSGESYSPEFNFKPRLETWYTWLDGTHLVGHHVSGTGSEGDGWVWQPGTAPKMIDLMAYPGSPYLGPYAGRDPWFLTLPDDPQECLSLREIPGDKKIPVLCDTVGVIGSDIALTHDGTGAVVALDVQGVEDPSLRRQVATAGAPQRVTFATDLIAEALDAEGDAS